MSPCMVCFYLFNLISIVDRARACGGRPLGEVTPNILYLAQEVALWAGAR